VPLLYNGPYSQAYQYDQWGNITYREGWGGENPSFTATYANNKRVGLTYDAAGNLTNDGGQNFVYDAAGQAATASYSGYVLQQYYDGNGLRSKKVEGTTTTYYLRSSVLGGQVVVEITGSGTFQRGYVYLGGELVALQHGGGVYWMHQDPVAKSKRVTDGAGTVVSTVELDPWGGNTNRSSNDAFQPRKFTTYERDGNGSDDAMFRRYNRWWSRFDQPDPYDGSYDLSDPQSFNRYAYVQNDPVNSVDPSGLDPQDPPSLGVVGDLTIYGSFDSRSGSLDSSSSGILHTGNNVFDGDLLLELTSINFPGGPQDRSQTQHPNPDCIMNAVSGATGLARPFGNVGPDGRIGHDGIHVVSPPGSEVRTLGVLAGTVLGNPHAQGDGLYAVDVLVPGVGVAIYKDLATVNVKNGLQLTAGTRIGTVGKGGDYPGLHFALLSGGKAEDKYYRGLTARAAAGDLTAGGQIQASMFINPNGPKSPVNCPGVAVNAAGVNPHP
jgi:RHS repeat-associated protein